MHLTALNNHLSVYCFCRPQGSGSSTLNAPLVPQEGTGGQQLAGPDPALSPQQLAATQEAAATGTTSLRTGDSNGDHVDEFVFADGSLRHRRQPP